MPDLPHPDWKMIMIGSEEHEASVLVARGSLAARERLFADLALARVAGGLSIETVAERIGVSTAEVLSIEAGQEDLTLTELRHVGIALGVVIGFAVGC